MSREAILKITEAEAEAERLVCEARRRAEEMLREAEAGGQELCRRAEEQTTAELAGVLSQIRAKIEQSGARQETELREELEAMKEAALMRRRIAEKIIVRGLEAKCR